MRGVGVHVGESLPGRPGPRSVTRPPGRFGAVAHRFAFLDRVWDADELATIAEELRP